ncbi:MAG: ergothioneine biosynthesis protein EgtB [Rhodospirillales bacterium]|nr:ergothioneine biosynthesis protein EgtB [Rhodospirillales bacterium]
MDRYRYIRSVSKELAGRLENEDQVVQPMADASPTKWHLGHTSWFFDNFLLVPHLTGYHPFDPQFYFIFNSYYEQAGERHPRSQRGLLSRPTVREINAYRAYVDEHMEKLISTAASGIWQEIVPFIELGLNHEQQHQELILTDILYVFSCNPLKPSYLPLIKTTAITPAPLTWISFEGGIREIGHDGNGFAYDNEGPRHRVFLEPFRLANRAVTNGEWKQFIEDGGYRTPTLWLSDGWALVQEEGWEAPLYWQQMDGVWQSMTLNGLHPVHDGEPITQISFYEADAFATWAGKRLPGETEWEVASETVNIEGNMMAAGILRPLAAPQAANESEPGLLQMFGDVWEWTRSPYTAYPGFIAPPGAVGEYNGKFMSNQMVLRGGSCATPEHHIRRTYRNFFYPHQRWQFSGLRLAEDAR